MLTKTTDVPVRYRDTSRRSRITVLAYKQTSTPLKINCLDENSVNQIRLKINKKCVLLHPSILNAPIVDEIIECH